MDIKQTINSATSLDQESFGVNRLSKLNILKSTSSFFHSLINSIKEKIPSFSKQRENKVSMELPHRSNPKKIGKIIKGLLVVLLVPLLVFAAIKIIKNSQKANVGEKRVEVKAPLATQEINKEFTFPLKDAKGKEVSSIKYLIEKAELNDELIIKGQRATAVKGRIFLVLTIKVTNEYDKPIEINTRDYVRLSVDGNEKEWLAPEIHNDPVEVQAISTKYTRYAFPINENYKSLTLQIGEVTGEKQKFPIEFIK